VLGLLLILFDISLFALWIENESSRIYIRILCKAVIFIEFRPARVEYRRKYGIIYKVVFRRLELLKDIIHNRENDIKTLV
jgi:ssDNA-specific exonuclease RecJ